MSTILVTGATGFIGRHLCRRFAADGDDVIVLSRRPDHARKLFGPGTVVIDTLDRIESTRMIDVIVNLAGAPITGGLWTRARKRLLIGSRLKITRALVRLVARLAHKPELLISGSAIGYYGIGTDTMAEDHPAGNIFQARLCKLWERAANGARRHGTRVCCLRTGVVLGRDGGALPAMLMPYRIGIATRFGDGAQWLSWIHIDDMVELVAHIIAHTAIDGPVNATAPGLVTQNQFTRVVGRQCHARIRIAVPRVLLLGLLGEMAQLFVDGQRVYPRKAIAGGFGFRHQTLVTAIRDLIPAKPARPDTQPRGRAPGPRLPGSTRQSSVHPRL